MQPNLRGSSQRRSMLPMLRQTAFARASMAYDAQAIAVFTRQFLESLGEPRDLRSVMSHDVLRMCEAVAQVLEITHEALRIGFALPAEADADRARRAT
jgi:hypothetical protein